MNRAERGIEGRSVGAMNRANESMATRSENGHVRPVDFFEDHARGRLRRGWRYGNLVTPTVLVCVLFVAKGLCCAIAWDRGDRSQMTSRRGGPGRGFQWGETPLKIKVSRSVPCRAGKGERSGTNITKTPDSTDSTVLLQRSPEYYLDHQAKLLSYSLPSALSLLHPIQSSTLYATSLLCIDD